MTINPDRLHVYLIAKREFYGAETPIGYRCSIVIELLDNRPDATGDQLKHIDENLVRMVRELEMLCADYVPVNEPPGTSRQ